MPLLGMLPGVGILPSGWILHEYLLNNLGFIHTHVSCIICGFRDSFT